MQDIKKINMGEEDNELTEEEKMVLQQAMEKYGSPQADIKHNVHTFLKEVLDTKDTTKVGFLSKDELGMPTNPVRIYKELALFSDKVLDNPFMKDLFMAEGENTFATSLSREGFLDKLAVVTKKIFEEQSKIKSENKGWFHKKENKDEQF